MSDLTLPTARAERNSRAASPWLMVPEAAEYARVGRTRVYDACRTGALRATQTKTPGGTWVIHTDDIDTWIRKGMPAEPSARLGVTA